MSTHIHVIIINTPVSLETLTEFFLRHNITPDTSSRGPTKKFIFHTNQRNDPIILNIRRTYPWVFFHSQSYDTTPDMTIEDY